MNNYHSYGIKIFLFLFQQQNDNSFSTKIESSFIGLFILYDNDLIYLITKD